MPDLWERPTETPETPAFDLLEGHPLPNNSEYEPQLTYYNEHPAREGRRVRGVKWYNRSSGDLATNPDDVENGVADLMRRLAFSAYNRLRRFIWITQGPRAWTYPFLIQGDTGMSPNFAHVYQIAASGKGTTLRVRWLDHQTTEPRGLWHSPTDSTLYSAIQPGLAVIDNRNGLYGMAEVVDFEFEGWLNEGEGAYHYGTLTVDKPLNANRHGALWIIKEHVLPAYPILPLSLPWARRTSSPLPCRHSVKVEHSALSTFAQAYPDAPMAQGIDGAHYCARMNADGVRLDLYAADCTATDCPYYEAHTEGIPNATFFNLFFLGRGDYLRQLVPGSDDVANFRIGREGWSGILQLMGLPVGYDYGGLYLAAKFYYGQGGVVEYRTGETHALGFDVFQTWDQWQAARLADGLTESDAFPLLAGIDAPAKRDPAGGAGPADRALVAQTDRTPGLVFESKTGVRRLAAQNCGPLPGYTGAGDAGIQRVRPRRYTSPEIALPIEPGTYGSETRLVLTSDGSILWTLPRFGETVARPFGNDSGGTATVAAASIDGDFLTLEFDLGVRTLYGSSATPQEVVERSFRMGGNVVASDLAHEITNPADVGRIGDRQWGLYPGRSIRFQVAGLEDLRLTCLSATAFGGAADLSGTCPDHTFPGVPQHVRANYNRRDRAVFALDGYAGQQIRNWIALGGAVGQTVAIEYGSIAPPLIGHDGLPTGYDPQIQMVAPDGSLTDVSILCDWDAANGTVRIDLGALALETGGGGWLIDSFRLHWKGWVFDTRRNHPAENVIAMDRAVDALLDGFWEAGTLSYPSDENTWYSYLRQTDMYWTGTSLTVSLSAYLENPDGDIWDYSSMTPTISLESTDWVWTEATGIICYSIADPVEDSAVRAVSSTFPVMSLDLGAFRYRAADIASAVIDIAVKNPELATSELEYNGDTSPIPSPDVSTVYTLTGFGIAFIHITYDGSDIDEMQITSAVEATWTTKTAGADTYAVSTCDCTQALKDLIGFITDTTASMTVGVCITHPNVTSGTFNPRSTLTQYTPIWYRNTGAGAGELAYHSVTRSLSADSLDCDNLRIRFTDSALTRGAVFHFDSAGQATAPNLMHGWEI